MTNSKEQIGREAIFPELKKSEDERIRKALITAVSVILKGNTLWHTDVTREEALAWLEKQVPVHLSHNDEIMIRQLTEYFTTGKGLQNTKDTVVEWLEDVKRKHDAYLKGVCDAKHELETFGSEQEGNSDKTANELHEPFVSADEKEQPKKKRPKMLNMFYALLMCLFYVALIIGFNILSHKLFGLYCGIDSITFSMAFSIIWALCYIHITED